MTRELTTGSERSPLYLRVVALIQKLAEEQCEDSASRAYAEATADLHEAAFADQGLKRGRGRLCVKRLVGKQCNLKDCTPPAGIGWPTSARCASLQPRFGWLSSGRGSRYVSPTAATIWAA